MAYLLKDFNAKLKQLELDQYDMNIDAVVNYIVGVGDVSIDIIQYGREWIKEHEDQKCSRNHLVALNAFIKFVGRDSYMCNDISKVFMRSFEIPALIHMQAECNYPNAALENHQHVSD